MKKHPQIDKYYIKGRITIEQVLRYFGHYPHLKGGDNEMIISPLRNNDKRPSFKITRNVGMGELFYDFGLNVGGDIFTLWELLSNTRQEFYKILEEMNDVFLMGRASSKNRTPSPLPAVTTKTEQPEQYNFQRVERIDPAHLIYDAYFEERGITEQTMRHFNTGRCTDSQHKMADRIPFEVYSIMNGKILEHVGRSTNNDDFNYPYWAPKGFKKSLELFNQEALIWDYETNSQKQKYGIIVVEGFSDVLWLWQNGFPNAVALMGTAMTEAHVKRVLANPKVNPFGKVTLFLDEDGKEGTKLANEKAYTLLNEVVDLQIVYPSLMLGETLRKSRTDPKNFSKFELIHLLGQMPVERNRNRKVA